jgi:hypothetical protein
MAGTSRSKALKRCKPGTGATAGMQQQSADKGRLLMVQTSSTRGHVWRGSVTPKAVKDKMSAVVKKAPAFPPASETALLTFCTGTLGYFHPVYFIDCQTVLAAQMPEHGGWPMAHEARFSFEGSRVSAGLRWARTGAVMSNPLLSRSSTP